MREIVPGEKQNGDPVLYEHEECWLCISGYRCKQIPTRRSRPVVYRSRVSLSFTQLGYLKSSPLINHPLLTANHLTIA
jgi:hypothetical protein